MFEPGGAVTQTEHYHIHRSTGNTHIKSNTAGHSEAIKLVQVSERKESRSKPCGHNCSQDDILEASAEG